MKTLLREPYCTPCHGVCLSAFFSSKTDKIPKYPTFNWGFLKYFTRLLIFLYTYAKIILGKVYVPNAPIINYNAVFNFIMDIQMCQVIWLIFLYFFMNFTDLWREL